MYTFGVYNARYMYMHVLMKGTKVQTLGGPRGACPLLAPCGPHITICMHTAN